MKKGDKLAALLIIALLVISTAGVFIYKSYIEGSSKIAVIKQNGTVIKTINLNSIKDNEEFIIKYDGNHFNKIRVEKGRISIIDADCPDKICVKTGWISNPGQNIVCLPHKLIISIEGKNSNYDDITR
ncbi:NusG domain II-containing protein [Clostridium sp. WILCCON 0269]|uniref:NusG domain II-containing protein n=1 Tax=Candidatus Clostridium eludens TaxID=3381663 RepID=A0ABW8SFI5_9CLOT